ncbi:phospholipase A [Sulfurimonas sp.]|jgi:phospholipase A1|uniref:phospholipase A n=1 Tax=Sulfurimonas sp. TaxID=2022749 RepID=UPI002A372450|nr:phospholipase A [Sulfurimonas sp.]MDY0123860.1 phospholipase A [Sulfurimonas sp.]
MKNASLLFMLTLFLGSFVYADELKKESNGDEAMKQFLFEYLDMPQDSDERESMTSKIFSNFGMLPHEKTFLIPLAYTTQNYETRDPVSYPGYDEFNKNIEAEFQISLKKVLSYNFFGLNEMITFGYTQEVWWQLYSDSAPFRETNYRPEIWLTLPIKDKMESAYAPKAIKIGFWHESNGMGEPLSREWNQLFVDSVFQYDSLLATIRVAAVDAGENNKDITSYLGYGHLKINYFLKKHQFDFTWRNNLRFNSENRGSIKAEWSYPTGNSKNNFWYLKIFNGYGASLVDYNHHQSRVGFGFLFSR